MALNVDIEENKLKENLLEIQKFNDEQINFYRENESTYYHHILEIINFIKNHEIEELSQYFYQDKDFIKDFKDLFLKLTTSEEYHRTSQKKSNFFSTISKLVEKISKYREEKKIELTLVQNELANYKKEFSDIQDTLEKYKETFKLFNNSVKEKEEFLNQKNDEILKIKQNVENFKNSFTENYKLYEARQYWSKKSKWHGWKSLFSFIIFLVIIGFVGNATLTRIEKTKQLDIYNTPTKIYIDKNISKLKINPELLEYNKNLERHELIRYVQYLFLLSLLIWVLRILLKITFSNLHLKEEAHEKETMILTYLALINEGAGLEENDRKLILEAIFRPSTNGLIKDESNVTLLDIVKSIKK